QASCALDDRHQLWCWGLFTRGDVPTKVDGDTTWTALLPTDTSGVVIGAVKAGQLYRINFYDAGPPAPVPDVGLTDWTTGADQAAFGCGVRTGGAMWCWGPGSYGQLGDGSGEDHPDGAQVAGPATGWTAVAAG